MLLFHIAKRKASSSFPDDTRGTTAIEFALIAPLLFAILFGIITFGLHYSVRIALTYAASEGGRAAVAGLSDAERDALARMAISNTLNALSPLVDPSNATVDVTTTGDSSGKSIDISIGYNDSRFAQMPFVPDLSHLAPVSVEYYVVDPSD